MPWSVWVVAVAMAATLAPGFGQYVVVFIVFACLVIFGWPNLQVRSDNPFIASLAGGLGINPIYLLPGILAAGVFALGLLFLIRASRRGPNASFFVNAGILLLGFLLVAATAIYRMGEWRGIG